MRSTIILMTMAVIISAMTGCGDSASTPAPQTDSPAVRASDAAPADASKEPAPGAVKPAVDGAAKTPASPPPAAEATPQPQPKPDVAAQPAAPADATAKVDAATPPPADAATAKVDAPAPPAAPAAPAGKPKPQRLTIDELPDAVKVTVTREAPSAKRATKTTGKDGSDQYRVTFTDTDGTKMTLIVGADGSVISKKKAKSKN